MKSTLNDFNVDTRDAIISLNDVLFCWQKHQPVLNIPELNVFSGERVFIRGPSGSGKTTLLGLLGGVLTPDSGQITVMKQDLSQRSPTERDQFRAHHIGFIFQMFNLIPYLSVLDNITLPLSFSKQRLQNVMEKNNSIKDEVCRLLKSLKLTDSNILSRPVTELSIGQQQRVAAARALIGGPELIIADEPTSALDSETREAFIQLLFAECKAANSTLVFVSHDATLEPLFDRTLPLNEINLAAATTASAEGL
ncbi:methionine ABC transporter ATP-binding protein [Endozoicomonas sp. (ex Bugula neritina AB1)]|nr:methionine ABC transporter ATP-binding protein [Endozoicomonas sp. (ex Bugula neritina AB1)]